MSRSRNMAAMRALAVAFIFLASVASADDFDTQRSQAMSLASEGQFKEALFALDALMEAHPGRKTELEKDRREVADLAEAALEEGLERAKKEPEQAKAILESLARRLPEEGAARARKALAGGDAGTAEALAAEGKYGKAADEIGEKDPAKAAWWRRLARYEGALDAAVLAKLEPELLTLVEECVEEFLAAETPDRRNEIFRRLKARDDATPDLVAAVILRGGTFEESAPGDFTLEYTLPAGEKRMIVVSVPEDYTPHRAWPVLIHLHGTNQSLEGCQGWAPHYRKMARGRYLVAQPVSSRHSGWGPMKIGEQQAPSALQFLRSKYNIDPDRIWLAGQSMGAHGTWHQAMRHGDLYAAYLPKSGSPYGAYGLNWEAYLQNLKLAPTYFIHGAQDPMFPVATPRAFWEKAKAAKLNVEYHEFAESGHEGAPDDEIARSFEWMLDKVRDAYPKTFSWTADFDEFARCWWVEATRLSTKGGTQKVQFVDQQKQPVESRAILNNPARFGVEVEGQTVKLEVKQIEKIRIWWSPRVLDLSKEVTIRVNGKQKWKGVPTVSVRQMLDEARRTGRRDAVYYGSQEIDVP